MNLNFLATQALQSSLEYKAAFGQSPNVILVPPFVVIELAERQAYRGFIEGLRVIESANVTKPIVAHVDPHTLGKLARIDS